MSCECRVCHTNIASSFEVGMILGNSVAFYECPHCQFVQTEQPYWLDKAYQSAINTCDTGIMMRNQTNVNIVLATLELLGPRAHTVIDCAGGYGILVRMLRDVGVDALWSDPHCQNLLAVGFERTDETANLVTAFEAFEHFVDPADELEQLLQIAPNVLISTVLMPHPTPRHTEWWYYGLDHGQHIGFFRNATLQYLAKRFNKYLISDGHAYHLFTNQPVSRLRWKVLKKLGHTFPSFLSRGMHSKVQLDHERMRESL